MRKLPAVIIILILVTATISGCIGGSSSVSYTHPSTKRAQGRILVYVTHVVDGDTAWVRFPNGTEEKVRFLGVDTPETEEDRNKPNEYDHITDLGCLMIWGLKAEQFTKETIEHKNVYLVFDPISPRRGYFGRLLAHIYLTNGTDFTAELIKKGYARVYIEGTFEKKDEYLKYQEKAMREGLGLWGACG